jgi:glycosyltransferase involved in cell wall biosynthesis
MNDLANMPHLHQADAQEAKALPLVSVSMPVFNSEKYISEAIESILAQTYTNFELIIVDDGSSDRTREIIDQFTDKRIIKVYSDQNRGLITTRNLIAGMAKGKYLALLDADDRAFPERLALQVDFLESNHADLCGADHFTLNQVTGERKSSKQRHSNSDIQALLSVCSPVCNPAMMGKLEIFKQFPYKASYMHAEDYCLWTEIALAGYRFANIKKKLITYRLHSTQTSVNHLQAARNVFSNAQASYLKMLGIPEACLPRPLPFYGRFNVGLRFIKLINTRIPDISIGANMELYARFQFRGNGLWTPLTRLERFCISLYGSMLGRLGKAAN